MHSQQPGHVSCAGYSCGSVVANTKINSGHNVLGSYKFFHLYRFTKCNII